MRSLFILILVLNANEFELKWFSNYKVKNENDLKFIGWVCNLQIIIILGLSISI